MVDKQIITGYDKLSDRLRAIGQHGLANDARQLEVDLQITKARLDIQRNNFAAAALTGLLGGQWMQSQRLDEPGELAYVRRAFQYADAMIEAAKK